MGLMAGMPGMERMRVGGMEGMQMTAKAPSGPQEKKVEGITFTFSTIPSPPKVGESILRVRLTGEKGETILNAKVSFSFTMPMPGMTAVSADAALSKEGFYETKANLGMGGTWNVTVRASIPGKPEVKATFAVATGGTQ
jgi:nitrogen fixation protein FixH